MKATVLVDNISCNELAGEWGLSIYIEYRDKKILLDTGTSELFLYLFVGFFLLHPDPHWSWQVLRVCGSHGHYIHTFHLSLSAASMSLYPAHNTSV